MFLRNPRSRSRRQRGSAVITVLILAAVTAVIATGFLVRSAQEARLASRSFYLTALLNLAEAGIEEGLYATNTGGFNTANGWSLISGTTGDYSKVISGLDLRQATGSIYIRVDGALGSAPVVTACGVATFPNQPRLVKQLRVGATSRRIWSNTVVGRSNITVDGSADVDAYDSSLGPYNPTTNRSDRASIATNATVVVSGSSTIYGYVATGGAAPIVGSSGRIYGATSPASPAVDTSRVRTDFSTNLVDATPPPTSGTAYPLGTTWPSSSVTLPRSGDTPGPNGRYLYTVTNVAVGGSDVLSIKGPVDLVATGNVTIGGSGRIEVGGTGATNPSLNLYSPGTISLNGNGMVNQTTNAAKISIWGTKAADTPPQLITLGGSSAFYGTIYAANGNITVDGNGSVFGALIGNSVLIKGSTELHYDTQLGVNIASGGPTPSAPVVRVTSWVELNSATGGAFTRDTRVPFNALF